MGTPGRGLRHPRRQPGGVGVGDLLQGQPVRRYDDHALVAPAAFAQDGPTPVAPFPRDLSGVLAFQSDVRTSSNPNGRINVPSLMDMQKYYMAEGLVQKELPVEKLLTSVSPLEEINDLMDKLAQGKAVRQVIVPGW